MMMLMTIIGMGVLQEFRMKMESLAARRDEIEIRENQLKESLLKFDTFIKVSMYVYVHVCVCACVCVCVCASVFEGAGASVYLHMYI